MGTHFFYSENGNYGKFYVVDR